MKPLLIAALCAAPLVPASTNPATTGSVAPAKADPFGFPAPSDGLLIESSADNPISLKDVVDTYGRVTGQTILYSDGAKTFLEGSPLNMSGPLEVPADRVQVTVESLVAMNDFLMVPLTDKAPRLVEIVSLQTAARSTVRKNAVHVDADQLDMAAEHPAVMCSTVVEMPHCDARQLSNSMRTMISDSNTQQILPAGNSSSMVLLAPGDQLADLARMLKTVDEAAAARIAELIEPEEEE